MRKSFAVLPLILTIVLVYLLDKPLGPLPALGRLLDPVNGFWANTEPVNKDFSADLKIEGVKQPVTVWLDERLVPHVKAANDYDIYFVQGYLHAYFRLWQMDMQTRAAAGRVSEVIGRKGFDFDRAQRRKGMVFAAENSLRAMEADPRTKQTLEAYTAGINSYISSLNFRRLPLEYKLMGFKPEAFTNLKVALMLKYMADDLTGETDDIALTILRGMYGSEGLQARFPEITGVTPVIPKGTLFEKPSMNVPEAPADSESYVPLDTKTDFEKKGDLGKGSNNWVLSGSRTSSGAAILCNDPHLGLNLPSLWYEMQLQTPTMNVYGVSLPGAPGVIIGFNDVLTWGFTNNYRDVKDFYAIKPSADNSSYLFNGAQVAFDKRIETISIKGEPDFVDTVRYTVHGPVMYDETFNGTGGLKKPLAMCWMAHRGTNELLSVYMLNRSKNYDEFVTAIQLFQCPAQNFAYADRQGNIALWGQGQFVNKWKGQGVYVMNGTDSSTLWKELIPMGENPHALNPEQGFLSSANQTVTDSTYPYWYNGTFREFRAWRINHVLTDMQKATIKDMFALQNDNYSVLASRVAGIMHDHVDKDAIGDNERQWLDSIATWDMRLTADSKTAAFFQVWWGFLYESFQQPEFSKVLAGFPSQERTMEILQADSVINDPAATAVVTKTFKAAIDSMGKIKTGQEWYHVKNTSVRHLTRIPAFSYSDLEIGGWGNTVNAAKGTHGPSWRMVVEMGKEINAYGVYPGGQSGNPGSKYYADFLNNWVKGDYYKLLFLPNEPKQSNSAIKYTMNIQPK